MWAALSPFLPSVIICVYSAIILDSNSIESTFSASLAVSLAFGRVVLICSCSKSDVTRLLHNNLAAWYIWFEYSSPEHEHPVRGRSREFTEGDAMLHGEC